LFLLTYLAQHKNHKNLYTNLTRTFSLAILLVTLAGCTAGTNAIFQTVENIASRSSSAADQSSLNPNFRYLRVTIDGNVALLALGDVDGNSRGAVEVWYSAQREVLRFQDGRLAGAAGLVTEWRSVDLSDAPTWYAMRESQRQEAWTRIRDVMPGYRFGIRDRLLLRSSPPLGKSSLVGIVPTTLAWFEERVDREGGDWQGRAMGGANPDDDLPPARYAVDYSGSKPVVIYGEQCLKPSFCFSWQLWPVSAR
jgi:hypothetical protein